MLQLILFILCFSGGLFATTDTQIIRNEAGKITAQYSYEGQSLHLRTFYTYDEKGRLVEVASYNGTAADPLNFAGVTEAFVTNYRHHPDCKDQDHPIEILKKYIDVTGCEEEQLVSHTFNTYGIEQELIQRENIDSEGTYTHMTFDKIGKPLTMLRAYKQGDQERMVFEYDKQGKLKTVSKETREGLTELIYDKKGFPILRRNPVQNSLENEPWAAELAKSVEAYGNLFKAIQRGFNKINLINRGTEKRFDENFEEYAKAILGPWTYAASGVYSYPQRIGIYGNGEISDNVRISLINGILNDPSDHMQNLELFCDLHGGVNIHYVFRPYEGYTKDILRCMFVKVGWISPQARELAKKWKELIAEMGGIGQGGTIIHYAHSIGGTDTYRARTMMTPEELKMIKVISIGSATMIPNRDFQAVINYTSLRDGVSQLIDTVAYLSGFLDGQTNIVYLDTLWGIPIIDHMINNPGYSAIVKMKGEEFINKYGRLTN